MTDFEPSIDRPKRERRYVRPFILSLLRPAFRHSLTREAYVLRVVGNTRGPVLRPSYMRPARLHNTALHAD